MKRALSSPTWKDVGNAGGQSGHNRVMWNLFHVKTSQPALALQEQSRRRLMCLVELWNKTQPRQLPVALEVGACRYSLLGPLCG